MYRSIADDTISPLRIGAGSIALGLHLIAFGVLLMPPRPLLPALVTTPQELMVELIAEVVAKPEPVPPPPEPPRRPDPTPRAVPTPVEPVVPVTLAESALPVPVAVPAIEDSTPGPSTDVAPVTRAAQIAYDKVPQPPYPGIAIRRRWEGTVMLRIRVDESGRPREVQIERSSGHRVLDQTASEHVLARWRFQPALQDGVAVPAWARVPIVFSLREG